MTRECVLCNSGDVLLLYQLKNVYKKKQFLEYMSGEGGQFADKPDNTLLFCNNCGLVFRSFRPRYELLQENYRDRWNYSCDEIRKRLERHYAFPERRHVLEEIKWIKEVIPKFRNDSWKILDVGPREGFTVKAFANMGWDAYGIEPTEPLAQVLRETYGLNIKAGMYEEDSYPLEVFDLIYASSVVHRFDEVGLFFRAAYKHLKKRGILFIRVFNVYDIKMNGLSEQHRVYFSPNTLRQAAQKHGFKEIRTEAEKPLGTKWGFFCALFEKVNRTNSFEFMCLDNFNLVKKAVIGADYCIADHGRKLDLNSFLLLLICFLETHGLSILNRLILTINRGCRFLKRLVQKIRQI